MSVLPCPYCQVRFKMPTSSRPICRVRFAVSVLSSSFCPLHHVQLAMSILPCQIVKSILKCPLHHVQLAMSILPCQIVKSVLKCSLHHVQLAVSACRLCHSHHPPHRLLCFTEFESIRFRVLKCPTYPFPLTCTWVITCCNNTLSLIFIVTWHFLVLFFFFSSSSSFFATASAQTPTRYCSGARACV